MLQLVILVGLEVLTLNFDFWMYKKSIIFNYYCFELLLKIFLEPTVFM